MPPMFKRDVQPSQSEALSSKLNQAISYRRLFEVNRSASSLIQSANVVETRLLSGSSFDDITSNIVKNLDRLKTYYFNKGDTNQIQFIDTLKQRVVSLKDSNYSQDWIIKNVVNPIRTLSTNIRKEVRIKILNSVPIPISSQIKREEKTTTEQKITPPEPPPLNVELSPVSEVQDESVVDWKGLGEETERKVLHEFVQTEYEVSVNELSKGYYPEESNYEMAIAELNSIDALFDEGYRRALENLGLSEKDVSELTNRVLSVDLLRNKGISIYPVAYVNTNEDNTALIKGYYPVLMRIIVDKGKTKLMVASPINGESMEQEIPELNKQELNKAVGKLLEHAEIQPGDYFLMDGTKIHKSNPQYYVDAAAFLGMVGGAAMIKTGVLAPVGTGLVYSCTAYFAGKSAYNLYNQIRFNTFDLTSYQTQTELGVLGLSLVPAAKVGVSQASKLFGLNARLNLLLNISAKGTAGAGFGLLYSGGTGYNAKRFGEQVKEGELPIGPLISEGFIIGASAFGMYGIGRSIVRDARLLNWHLVSERKYVITAESVEDVNKHAIDFVKDLPGNQEVYYYSVDKRSTNAINTITSKSGGDYILRDYRRMLANISKGLNRLGYKTMVIVHGGDEASILTTADRETFFKVFNEHEYAFRRFEEHALRGLIKKGLISPSEKSSIIGVNLERGEMGSKPAGKTLNLLVVENKSVKEIFSSVLAQDTPELRVIKSVFLETGKPTWGKVGNLKDVVIKAARENKEAYYIKFDDAVVDPKVKDAFAVYSKNNGGKGIIRLNKGELPFVNYNNVDHLIGDNRLWINESAYPKELGKYYEIYAVRPNEYLIVTPEGENISGFVRSWESNVNSKLNGVKTSLSVIKVSPSNVNQLIEDPLYLSKKASYRVITYYREGGFGKDVVYDRAVQHLKNLGFDLDNLPKKIRTSDLVHIINKENKSLVDAIREFDGWKELLKGDIQGFDVTEYFSEDIKHDFLVIRRAFLMYKSKSRASTKKFEILGESNK